MATGRRRAFGACPVVGQQTGLWRAGRWAASASLSGRSSLALLVEGPLLQLQGSQMPCGASLHPRGIRETHLTPGNGLGSIFGPQDLITTVSVVLAHLIPNLPGDLVLGLVPLRPGLGMHSGGAILSLFWTHAHAVHTGCKPPVVAQILLN